MNRKAIIEGLLYVSGEEGLTLDQLAYCMECDDLEGIKKDIEALKVEYETRGVELVEFASRYKFVTKEFVYPYAQKLYEDTKMVSLSQAAMETLAIIAYKQPITRVEIEEIRGVNCEVMLKKLAARGLVEATDRLDTIGKPLLYCVTKEFLDAFQLETLEELPALNTIKQEDLFAEVE